MLIKKYYTYKYSNPLKNNEEFYIGYSGDSERLEDHLKESQKYIIQNKSNKWISKNCSNPHKIFTIMKILKAGLEPSIIKVSENIDRQTAINDEIRLIALYGRADKGLGSLTNKTDGGDGGATTIREDLSNQRFGRLTAIKFINKTKHKTIKWLCRCDCGNERIVASQKLKEGKTKSCGCLQKELFGKRNTTHGKTKTPAYYKWQNLRKNKNHIICDRWKNSFENFYEDMGDRPSNKHKLKKIDKNKPFEPSNCLWIL